jgi:membrane associated rhomboid family serine protease
MHAGWVHLILNCWAIIVFGREVERILGARRYLALAFASGIVGGVFQVLVALAWPSHFGGEVVGASACAFGLVAAFAMMFPEQELTMLVFFVIPVRMRAHTLLLVSLVIALVGITFPMVMGNVAHAAHLGGMAMGWFYIKKIIRNPALLDVAQEPPHYRPEPVETSGPPAAEFDDADVDAVLDKISARGISSLTSRERAILEAARKRMARR